MYMYKGRRQKSVTSSSFCSLLSAVWTNLFCLLDLRRLIVLMILKYEFLNHWLQNNLVKQILVFVNILKRPQYQSCGHWCLSTFISITFFWHVFVTCPTPGTPLRTSSAVHTLTSEVNLRHAVRQKGTTLSDPSFCIAFVLQCLVHGCFLGNMQGTNWQRWWHYKIPTSETPAET